MPTGYTAAVCDGTLTDFNTFALRCARAMGACVMQRDEPMDVLPSRTAIDSYYLKSLGNHRAELARLQSMTPQEADAAAISEYEEIKKRNQERLAETKAILDRLQSMRSRVADWKPPTGDHVGLKEFMLEQIDQTIEFDGKAYLVDNVLQPGHEWLSAKIAKALKDIAYDEAKAAKESERNGDRFRWINQLYYSLEA